MATNIIRNDPDFYLGVVEDRMDPLMLGRARVRILGLHTHDKAMLPTEDLPWAYKIQPTTSGAISGIGHAPVGVMEGSWVILQFIDPDRQMPFIVGSIGGIPQTKEPPLESFELLNQESNVTPSTPTAPAIPANNAEKTETITAAETGLPVKLASQYSTSEEGLELIRQKEGFRANAYQDSVGKWTIGYGSTILADGSAVTGLTPPMTKAQANSLLILKVGNTYEPIVKANVRAPITQSMFDALVCLCYNVPAALSKTSSVTTRLNANDYNGAADAFLLYNKATINGVLQVVSGLTTRRQQEKALFLSDGIPKPDGSIAETPASMAADEKAIQSAPGGVAESSPAATSATLYERRAFNGQIGFRDPKGKYPLQTHLQEPDTNRLARHQKIKNTIVYFKEAAEHKNVPVANSAFPAWSQAKTPYNAQYPFNNVWQSESGHVLEFDDTPGKERIHTYHMKGTFWEVDHNGTMVRRVVGDDYQLLERNGHLHVIGNVHVCVEGAKTLKVLDTLNVEINGATTVNIHDNAVVNVGKSATVTAVEDISVRAGGDIGLRAGGAINLNASEIGLMASTISAMGSNIGLQATSVDVLGTAVKITGGKTSVSASGLVAIDGGAGVKINQGLSDAASTDAPGQAASPGFTTAIGGDPVSLEALMVKTRGEEAGMQYESPDDGDATAWTVGRIQNGTLTVQDALSKPTTLESTKPADNGVTPVINPCGIPEGTTIFDYNKKISKYFTLGDLTQGGSRKLKSYGNYRADQIYCFLVQLANNVLDPIKAKYDAMTITSGYRDFIPSGGSTTSQHLYGQAVDIAFDLSRSDLYYRALEIQKLVPYDQLILEYDAGPGWIHLSFNPSGNRKQQFTYDKGSRVSKDLYTIAKIY